MGKVLIGTDYRTIDNKGRIFIPSKYREDLIKGMIISKGFDEKCIFIFSIESWKKLVEKISSEKVTERNKQKFSRWFFSSANEGNMDQQGRVRIPQELIDYAELKKDVVIIGVSDRTEIWAKEIWPKYYEQANSQFTEEGSSFEELRF